MCWGDKRAMALFRKVTLSTLHAKILALTSFLNGYNM
jgi:hypothetical protein